MDVDDEIIVNLIVISKTQINTKLYTSGIYLNLEQPSYIPEGIRRWVRKDSRDETIKKVDRVITRAIDQSMRDDKKSRYFNEHLLAAKTGLLNLRETYSNCIQTVARLDTIVNKMSFIEETKSIQRNKKSDTSVERSVERSDECSDDNEIENE
jgi:(p)ppGpp synthase/HD superfamily hydrolase